MAEIQEGAGYWSLRAPDSPLPEDDMMEMYLLMHSKMLDRMNRMTAEGRISFCARWELYRTPSDRETSEDCDRIASWIMQQPGVQTAHVAWYDERNVLWIAALLHDPAVDSYLGAMKLSREIGDRLARLMPWDTVPREDWEPEAYHAARIDRPSPVSMEKYDALKSIEK